MNFFYSRFGSQLAVAIMRLLPSHRRLSQVELDNLREYFTSDYIATSARRYMNDFTAFIHSYFSAIRRIATLNPKARQDYFAIHRQGKYVYTMNTPLTKLEHTDSEHLPVIIVPGLNTPSVYFREMAEHFSQAGYNVSVLELPERGLADVATSAKALQAEIKRVKEICKATQVNVIGHCLGGLIAQHYVEKIEPANKKTSAVKTILALGTGFMGACGVQTLKELWLERHPGQTAPRVFDELIHWDANVIWKNSSKTIYHSIFTVWDFIVRFRKGFLAEIQGAPIVNHMLDDPDLDHLALALHPKAFRLMESLLSASLKPFMPAAESASDMQPA